MHKTKFYKMLSAIHNEVSNQACGCMGYDYTPDNVELNDTHSQDYNNPRKIVNGTEYPTYVPSDRKLDYIGNVLRQYIEVEE